MTSTTPPRPSAAERLRAEHGPALTLGNDCGLPDDLVVAMLAGSRGSAGCAEAARGGTSRP
ncbi:hypothetical protein ACIPJK_00765 [Streptomyces roseus]|uniref:hypothetical protein n=1 Tax=Streptomyces roseus TaxID=66430 RepID=UPI000AE2DA54